MASDPGRAAGSNTPRRPPGGAAAGERLTPAVGQWNLTGPPDNVQRLTESSSAGRAVAASRSPRGRVGGRSGRQSAQEIRVEPAPVHTGPCDGAIVHERRGDATLFSFSRPNSR